MALVGTIKEVVARLQRRIAPLQFAAAGRNAHVNHDLAVVNERTTELARRAMLLP